MVDKPKRTRVSINLTQFYIDGLDALVESGIFIERQDAIRESLRDLFLKHGVEAFTDKREPRIIERE